MERKIGEIFEYNGEWYQTVKSQGKCCSCDFMIDGHCIVDFSSNGSCFYCHRKDKENVIFKKLKKAGEPYEFDGHLFQSYRTFEVPIFTENYATVRELGNNSKISIEIKQTKEDMEEKNNGNTPLNVLTDKYVNGDICYDDFEKEVKALYSCKEEIKPTLKEFDLEAAKLGKPVCTRDGRKVRIICFDTKGSTHPIVALIEKDEKEVLSLYMLNGKKYEDEEEWKGDLMMLPEKKEGWINVYNGDNSYSTGSIYSSKEEAEKQKDIDCVATIKIEWEE